jgi:GAF domain-containing protein
MKKTTHELEEIIVRERSAKIICAELNNFVDLKSTLITVMDHAKKLTNCEAVGIRLHDEGDYPYFVHNGFPESFIKKENSLCSKDEQGQRINSPDGNGYLLDCMCGNIIRGRFDSSLPFFTKKGSFWSNNTSVLLATTTEKERGQETRNYCNSCGYDSVALIPIKVRNERIGLIQLNDKRVGMFSESRIEFMEMIGEQIGLAVQNSLIYSKLRDALAKIKVLEGILPICCSCKKIRDDEGYWHHVEVYIRDHSEAAFTHGICPECKKKFYLDLADEEKEH